MSLQVQGVFDLSRYGDAPALVLDDRLVTYAELQQLVNDRAAWLGPVRRLVMVEGANALEPIVTYLAALAGGHPVLLVPGTREGAPRRQWDRLLESYRPDVTHRRDGVWSLEEHRAGTVHELHPDLALLLGTSGSTGTPKLVRLSRENLVTNAEAIAESLGITADDRAATSLPVHYCYGLSVLNSHLVRGASLWLTERSVVEDEFWDGFARHRATSFAGVPYTFELLEQSGFEGRDLSSLRLVTQAGGAMPADRARAWARRGEEHGFDLVVMYGQTEATARMAYLPPHLAAERAGTIGIPIPGGDLRIEGGELVYSGPNVMLGYAETPADLALGRTVHELRTGDLARQHDDGLYEITGRCNRLAKLFGTRLDLDVVERLLGECGIDARAIEHDGRLAVFVRRHSLAERVSGLIQREHCLPAHAVDVTIVDRFPVTPNGKTDYPALARHVADRPTVDDSVRAMYATVLGRPDAGDDDSFVSLRGDSLSFVEVSYRLERMLGHLPRDWPERSIAELDASTRRRRRWTTRLETAVVLRALAIVLVVGSHVELFDLMGGAHVMLGVVGFNLARFQLAAVPRRERLALVGASLRELVVPAVLWIGGVALVSGKYDLSTVLLANSWFGPGRFTDQWQFWFLEAVLWTVLGIGALVAVPVVDRWERARPFAVALVVLAATLALRLVLAGIEAGPLERYAVPTVAWSVALGWVIARATSVPQRVLASALVVVSCAGFFGEPRREVLVIAGLLLLAWLPRVPVPALLARVIVTVGAATYFIYLTHWVVYPPLEVDHSVLALLASLAVGIVTWQAYGLLRRRLTR
ncbi:AMP-binding protein [Aeromicrobium terrae]|uniref:AMP-binding protein n=1 Tax=Aeromicrobium terrae TaxID=2498846 RepID=A0A5C8NGB8_9ACTN|nr:AMP-binding protein [Aeromicrobium terrae]TXL57588.1 AMP-binding protein [Aeromicrobium terrae]